MASFSIAPFKPDPQASAAALWSERRVLAFTTASSGIHHVAFAASYNADAKLGSVAIADIQLEAVSQGGRPTDYVATSGSRMVHAQRCPRGGPDLRDLFEHKCDSSGCYYEVKATMIFINQLREKIGVMFGSPETTTGGKALKFYASVRLDIRRIEALKDGTDVVGNRTRVKVVKNKMAPPFKQAEFDIIYGLGISREGSLIDVGVEQGIVRKAGAWYTYDGEQLGSGQGERADVPA